MQLGQQTWSLSTAMQSDFTVQDIGLKLVQAKQCSSGHSHSFAVLSAVGLAAKGRLPGGNFSGRKAWSMTVEKIISCGPSAQKIA